LHDRALGNGVRLGPRNRDSVKVLLLLYRLG